MKESEDICEKNFDFVLVVLLRVEVKIQSWVGIDTSRAIEVNNLADEKSLRWGRGKMPLSAQRVIAGLVRKAPVVRRRLVYWTVSRSLRYDGFARPYKGEP